MLVLAGQPDHDQVIGLAGFDWLLLDAEHAPNDVLSLIPQLMALKDSSSAPVVRPPWNDAVVIKRLLDAGVLQLPDSLCRDPADDARRAVAATDYPPHGIRGVSVSHRSNRYGTVPEYMQVINDNISVMVQVESRAGIEALDEICAVPGVDGIFIGPSDLAAGYGHLGQPSHPEVQAAMARVFESTPANMETGGNSGARRHRCAPLS